VIDVSRLRVSELVGVVYFGYLAVVALLVQLPADRRLRVWMAAILAIAVEVGAGMSQWMLVAKLRDWLPPVIILMAYFATGAFYVEPSPRVEAWLQRWDDRLIGGRSFDRLPPALCLYLDVVYDACFLMIPAGFAVLLWAGGAALADRFWTLVLVAEFCAFGTLPWLQARPPWAIEGRRAADRTTIRRFSLFWVNHTSIRANTFPSGHASASLAVALALAPTAPWAAVLFGVLALSIAVASVVGRFHYAIDAITGLLLAIVVWLCAAALGV
jgi:membrane-associated phospholipid phosphatase